MSRVEGGLSTTEKITRISKVSDIIGVAYGLVIGGLAGFSLVFLSASTYYLADKIEKRVKK